MEKRTSQEFNAQEKRKENRINYVLKRNLPTGASLTANSSPASGLMWHLTDFCLVLRLQTIRGLFTTRKLA